MRRAGRVNYFQSVFHPKDSKNFHLLYFRKLILAKIITVLKFINFSPCENIADNRQI